MFFDQAVFEQPGINLCIYNGECNLTDFGNQYSGFPIHLVILIEIGANPVSQVFGLTNINERIILVPVLIDTGPVRYIAQCLFIIESTHLKSQLLIQFCCICLLLLILITIVRNRYSIFRCFEVALTYF